MSEESDLACFVNEHLSLVTSQSTVPIINEVNKLKEETQIYKQALEDYSILFLYRNGCSSKEEIEKMKGILSKLFTIVIDETDPIIHLLNRAKFIKHEIKRLEEEHQNTSLQKRSIQREIDQLKVCRNRINSNHRKNQPLDSLDYHQVFGDYSDPLVPHPPISYDVVDPSLIEAANHEIERRISVFEEQIKNL